MSDWRIKFSLILTYFVFAILLNSVGTVIMQVINTYDIAKHSAAILEGFKDIPIAIVSFVVASFLPRIGYRNAMMVGLVIVIFACLSMPLLPSFLTTKILFLCIGVSFALIKVSVYSTVGLVTGSKKEHASFMNMIEGLFMVGVLSGYWLFSSFIDSNDVKSLDWLNIYWFLAVLCALNILVLFTTPFDESKAQAEKSALAEDFINMLKLVARPMVYIFVISAFLYVLIEQSIMTWLPTFNNEIMKLPTAMSVQATSIFAACLAIGRLSAGGILKKINWYPLVTICTLIMIALILIILPMTNNIPDQKNITWQTAPLVALMFPLIGLFMAPIYPVIISVMLSSLPVHKHSAMTGLIVAFSALGGTSGSMITGYVFGRFDGQTAFYFSLVPLTVILLVLYLFKRATDRNFV
ncbi:MAG: MFS transporter [Alphaproteobacteria bacterium]|nr:MAG: MFS transporter [Alphaproteobacteria bacterium]